MSRRHCFSEQIICLAYVPFVGSYRGQERICPTGLHVGVKSSWLLPHDLEPNQGKLKFRKQIYYLVRVKSRFGAAIREIRIFPGFEIEISSHKVRDILSLSFMCKSY